MDILIRQEKPEDYRIVEEVTREAFWNHHVPGCDEHYLIHKMRNDSGFIQQLDMVAIYNGRIIGNIAYMKSQVIKDNSEQYEVLTFGPISVLPEFQNMGVGRKLIEYTVLKAKEMGFKAIFIYGDPDYYRRFGFVQAKRYDVRTSDDMYIPALQVMELSDGYIESGRFVENKVYEIDTDASSEFDKGFIKKEKRNDLPSQQRFRYLVSLREPRAASCIMSPINIKKRLEVFWDDTLVDTKKTTASKKLHESIRRELAITHDEPWEGDCCDYHNFFKDSNGLYRMYYLGWNFKRPGICVCYAESTDGVHWIKPELGICEYNGSTRNNIILDPNTAIFDNFMVIRDPNQNEGSNELYKGICSIKSEHAKNKNVLWCFTSPDGIHFRKAWIMSDVGAFDTLNTVVWDQYTCRYYTYIRDYHNRENCKPVRDIRVMISKDFHEWTTPELLDFMGGDDYPLYTNVVQKYYRADHIFIGFPSRYVERPQWNSNFDRLCGKEKRLERMRTEPRFGLAVTDCVFMCSRDGMKWNRTNEAFMRPGPEEPYNWVYGDCYPALGVAETYGSYPGTDNELSLFSFSNHWSNIPAQLWRYTIRLDGFISRHAGYDEKILVTKPFIFEGDCMHINFSTSAIGYLYFTLRTEEGRTIESDEIFGDSTDRIVDFKHSNITDFVGRSVVMEIRMKDADIYSFCFI